MSIGLLGTKIGMIGVHGNWSIRTCNSYKSRERQSFRCIYKGKRGYNAVKVGFFKLKNSKLTKQMKGYFAKKNTEPKKFLKSLELKKATNLKRVMNLV